MPESNFGSLGERLLRAGVAPRHVRRLVAELETHYASLVEEESARGQPLALARGTARARLGTDDEIVSKTREQSSLRSWGARWPLAIYAVAPVLGVLGSAALMMIALVAALSLATPQSPPAPWLRIATALAGWLLMYGVPLTWAAVLAHYSVARRLSWHWVVTGLLLTAAAGALTNFSVTWPGPGIRGALSGGVGWRSDSAVSSGIRWLVTLTAGLAVYLLIRPRRTLVSRRAAACAAFAAAFGASIFATPSRRESAAPS